MIKNRQKQRFGDADSGRLVRGGFTVIEMLVCTGILLVVGVLLLAMFAPVSRGRYAARRTQCKNNLKQIGLAIHQYHDRYNSLPPVVTVDAEGRPLHSWRTLILPFLDQKELYGQIDLTKPWNDPANTTAAAKIPAVYCCPTSYDRREYSSYLAVTWAKENPLSNPPKSLDRVAMRGTTIMVVEVPQNLAVHWMTPSDADSEVLEQLIKAKDHPHDNHFHIAFADGSVRAIDLSEIQSTDDAESEQAESSDVAQN